MCLRPRVCMAFMLCFWLFARVQAVNAQQGVFAPPDPAPPARNTAQVLGHPAEASVWTSASDAVGLIRLDVTVHDEKGNLVPGLPPSDFTLLENEKPDKILSFRAFEGGAKTAEPPIEVILFLDTIG